MHCRHLAYAVVLFGSAWITQADTIRVGDLDLSQVGQGWGEPRRDRSVDNAPLTVAGVRYEHGSGNQARRISQTGSVEVWAKNLADGGKAVGLFNRGRRPAPVNVIWAELDLTGQHVVRDLWRQQNIGSFADHYQAEVPRHGVVLVRIK